MDGRKKLEVTAESNGGEEAEEDRRNEGAREDKVKSEGKSRRL